MLLLRLAIIFKPQYPYTQGYDKINGHSQVAEAFKRQFNNPYQVSVSNAIQFEINNLSSRSPL